MVNEFSPTNKIVQLCIQGMAAEDKGDEHEGKATFRRAWEEADQSDDDLGRFLAAFNLARHQENAVDELEWLLRVLHHAQRLNEATVKAAFPSLFARIAESYTRLGNDADAETYRELAASSTEEPSDDGPFYHGTRADLQVGDLLTPGGASNYQADLVMNHIYFTALRNGAGLAASLAKGEGRERVYVVEPTGAFENDPNVTNKKFPGNMTRSYRSLQPLRIVGEVTDWSKQTPSDIKEWKAKLARSEGKIIN